MTDSKNNTPEKDKVQYVAISPDMFQAQNNGDEIDLRELWNVIWRGKWIIIAVTALFAIASVFYSLSLPNVYRSTVTLAPVQSDSANGLSSMVSQFGGLASMAGINIPGGNSNKVEQAVMLLNSWAFLSEFIKSHKILPEIIAVKKWDEMNRAIIFDENIYDSNGTWLLNKEGRKKWLDNNWFSYKALKNLITVEMDEKTNFVSISVDHQSPDVAFRLVNLLKKDINDHFQKADTSETLENIAYLENKIRTTSITEMRTVFYNMIENQTKTLMLANVSNEYLLKTVVPAMPAVSKVKPSRALICSLGTVGGAMLGVLLVIFRSILGSREQLK